MKTAKFLWQYPDKTVITDAKKHELEKIYEDEGYYEALEGHWMFDIIHEYGQLVKIWYQE